MAGIAILVPNEDMFAQAQEIIQNHKNHVCLIKYVKTQEAVAQARCAIAEGATIIVARGKQAVLIKRSTNVPVVEIIMTAQELGLLITKAKKIVKRTLPKIGLIAWGSMLCDTTYFNEIYDVDLKTYTIDDEQKIQKAIDAALEEEMDLIIGGEAVHKLLEGVELPFLFLDSTGESIQIALHNAETLYYANEVERYNYAQLSSLLDTAFNGFVKVNSQGEILVINHVMEDILKLSTNEVAGRHVTEVLNGIDQEAIEKVLNNPKESYSAFVNIKDEALVVLVVPIVIDDKIDGAIFSCNRVKRAEVSDSNSVNQQYLKGYVATKTFKDIKTKAQEMKKTIELAKFYSQSSSPVLLIGETGDETQEMAQGIHNYGLKKAGPYVSINIAGLSDVEQTQLLFGKPFLDKESKDKAGGMILEANHGTLVIHAINEIGVRTQYYLSQIIKSRTLTTQDHVNPSVIDVRIIGVCMEGAFGLTAMEHFNRELYYMFHTMSLKIPPLRDRKEDMETMIDDYVQKYMKRYSRFHIFSAGAKKALVRQRWKGNRIQLETFCERMVLTVGKRVITEGYVESLLKELYAEEFREELQAPELEYDSDPYAVLLKDTLKKYKGNRGLAAKALNISTTTLWRKMKKYGLE